MPRNSRNNGEIIKRQILRPKSFLMPLRLMAIRQPNVILNPIQGKMSKNPYQPANVYSVNPMAAPIRKGMQYFCN